jgi:hypothetical protein
MYKCTLNGYEDSSETSNYKETKKTGKEISARYVIHAETEINEKERNKRTIFRRCIT